MHNTSTISRYGLFLPGAISIGLTFGPAIMVHQKDQRGSEPASSPIKPYLHV